MSVKALAATMPVRIEAGAALMENVSWRWLPRGLLLAGIVGSACVGATEASSQGSQAAPLEADRAAAIARKSTGGRVLDVRLMDEDVAPRAYAVRLLLDPGRVRTVVVDGDSEQLR